MILYNENYPAPNPRKVRIFLAEKGLTSSSCMCRWRSARTRRRIS